MKENIKSLGIIALGNLLLTSAYAFLTVPNNIINGGVTSTSLLLKISFIVLYLVVFVILCFSTSSTLLEFLFPSIQ